MANQYFQILSVSNMMDQRISISNLGGFDLILSAYDKRSNFEFADRYTITVNFVDTDNKKISVALSAETLHNPFIKTNILDIPADGQTYSDKIIPGFGFKFADASTIAVGVACEVYIGDLLVDGTITAGDSDDADKTVDKLAVMNLHTATLSGCKASVVAKPRTKNISGNPIIAAKCNRTWSSDTIDMTMRFAGYVPGSNQVCQIDGGTDISIICDSTSWNEVIPGLFIIFNNAVSITEIDASLIRVSDGYRYVELAENDNGTPGAWSSSPVMVREDGQVSGMIQTESVGFFWKKILPTSNTDPSGNPREYQLLVQGDITS